MSKFQLEDSPLQKARFAYIPKLPASLSQDVTKIGVQLGSPSTPTGSSQKILQEIFKNTYGKPLVTFVPGTNDGLGKKLAVGFILSGGQAPGGHNVIAGLFDGLKKGNPESKLYGFLDGPGGLIKNKTIEITTALIDKYRNTGGFDMIGSGRTKIETPEQFSASLKNAQELNLDAVVIIGGDDSNTNAALLAEYFEAHAADSTTKKKVAVVGVPKTIDGDLKNEYIETSFGFDTACKVYSDLIGNIQRDTVSSQKHWHFIKLMGRSASHITLECALQTHANVSLISEEVGAKQLTLGQIVDEICTSVVMRASGGQDFGTVLIPEGLVEFVPEMRVLISELNDILALHATEFGALGGKAEAQRAWLATKLSPASAAVYASLPPLIADELVLERDPHGNVIVSSIETEKLLMDMTAVRLAELKRTGKYTGTFSAMTHFFGFEGRCAFPTNFDADYCYSLGFSAFVLAAAGLTGYMASVRNLVSPASAWVAGGIPLTAMMDMEQRKGTQKPVIRKALVELQGAPFKALEAARTTWAVKTSFLFPGAIQYWGPPQVSDQPTITLTLEHTNEKK